jgi:hypothetical protein
VGYSTIMLAISESIGWSEVDIVDEDDNLSQSGNPVDLHSTYMGNCTCCFPSHCHSSAFNIPSI